MSSSPRFARDVLWNVASLAVLGVSGIALQMLVGRYYGAPVLGAFNQVLAAYIVFSQLAVCGVDRSVLRAVSEVNGDRPRSAAILLGSLVPTLALASGFTVLFALSARPLSALLESPPVARGVLAAAPGLFCFALNKVLLGAVNGLQRMRAYAVFQALRYLLILAGLLLALAVDLDGELLPVVFSLAEGVLLLALLAEVSVQVRWWRGAGARAWAARHLRYGLKSALSGVLLELNARVDILMLGWYLDDGRVGVYSMAALFAEGCFQLVVVLQANYNPILSQLLADGSRSDLERMFRRVRLPTVGAFLLVWLVAVPAYGPGVELLTANPALRESLLSFAILLGGVALTAGYMPFQQVLLMGDRPAWHSAYMACVVGLNIVGNALLIPPLGIEGAALATAFSLLGGAALVAIFARRLLALRL